MSDIKDPLGFCKNLAHELGVIVGDPAEVVFETTSYFITTTEFSNREMDGEWNGYVEGIYMVAYHKHGGKCFYTWMHFPDGKENDQLMRQVKLAGAFHKASAMVRKLPELNGLEADAEQLFNHSQALKAQCRAAA